MKAAVSRADLLRAHLDGAAGACDALALRLGYRRVADSVDRSKGREGVVLSTPPEVGARRQTPQPTSTSAPFAPVPLWVVTRRHWEDQLTETAEFEDDARSRHEPDRKPEGLRDEDLRVRDLPSPPQFPIAPWPVLRRALDDTLVTPRPRRALDVEALVARWAKGQPVRHLPRLAGRTYARLALLVDGAPHLAPLHFDLMGLVASFDGRLDRKMLRILPTPQLLGGRPLPSLADDEIVLAVSDLGHYAGAGRREAWMLLGRRLERRGDAFCALVPVPRHRLDPALSRLWSAMDWSAPRAVDPSASGGGGRRIEEPVEASEGASRPGVDLLLSAMAPALRVEPGLLRALRRCLGSDVDLGCEVEVGNHPLVRGGDSSAICIDLPAAPAWQQRFRELDHGIKVAVAETLVAWHRHLPLPIRWAEALQLREAGIDLDALDGELADAAKFLERAAESLEKNPATSSSLGQQVDAYWQRFRRRAPSRVFHAPDLRHTMARVEKVLKARYPDLEPAAGSNPGMLLGEAPPRPWTLWQEGHEVRARPRGEPGKGSPLVDLEAARLSLEDGRHATVEVELDGDAAVPWPKVSAFQVISEAEVLEVRRLERPPWSKAVGRDRFGLWADLDIEGVVQRMRWIPPGRFWMGSPEGEEGRLDREGPQHEVILTEGFWLADTPCTQELWQAVMGSNPSTFRSPRRPVEKVSWNDCANLVEKLVARGLSAKLPTEAQWEYACRGGTTTATWLGDLELIGANNAPLLHKIAWYGGNSGLDFELDSGWDAKGWGEKQFEFDKAGSHEVGLKQPNPLGLYDMLGNVYEWCLDGSRDYRKKLEMDPEGTGKGVYRVIRGGSWYVLARGVRAAYRYWYPPGLRFDRLGFRLSLGGGRNRGAVESPGRGAAVRSGPRSGDERSESAIENHKHGNDG